MQEIQCTRGEGGANGCLSPFNGEPGLGTGIFRKFRKLLTFQGTAIWRTVGLSVLSATLSYLPLCSLYRERQTSQIKEMASRLTKMQFPTVKNLWQQTKGHRSISIYKAHLNCLNNPSIHCIKRYISSTIILMFNN